MPENPSEIKSATGAFDIDRALNTSRFAEFLGKFRDHSSLDFSDNSPDAETIKERFEAFTLQEKVAKEYKKLYSDIINRDIGVRLPETEFSCIDDFFETQAVENPGSISEFHEEIQEFQRLPQDIAFAEKTLRDLGGSDNIKTERDAIDDKLRKAQDERDDEEGKDVEGKRRGRKQRREAKAARLASIQQEIDRLQSKSISYTEKIESLDAANKAKEDIGRQADELRLKIFEDFAPAKEILEKAKAAASKKYEDMSNKASASSDLKLYEQQQAYFDKVTGAKELFDYTEDWNLFEKQGLLDERIQWIINLDIIAAIREFQLGGSSPLASLEQKLDSYLKKEQIGSRKGEDAREFILQTLQERAQAESEPAKLILLNRIIAKFAVRKIS